MFPSNKPFAQPLESRFQASRMAALAEINSTTFWIVAALVMAFSVWDWFVDPVHWRTAFMIRCAGCVVILASGVIQRASQRVDWAPALSKIRYAAMVVAVAAAIAVLDNGYVVGLAGLVAAMLAGPYIALGRRDLLVMNLVPLPAIAVIMYAAGLDRFTVINSAVFIVLAVAVSLLLARVFEASNRRAFLLEHELTREARTDALTGLRNRRSLEEIADIELKRINRTPTPLATIICDIDHFKSINDRHGHEAGDGVIRAVAQLLGTVARETDAVGRWGGEEFLVILPGTDERAAAQVAERMRAVVENAAMPTADGAHVTLSFGVAALDVDQTLGPTRWGQLLRLADGAMYRAKAAGRNRVIKASAASSVAASG